VAAHHIISWPAEQNTLLESTKCELLEKLKVQQEEAVKLQERLTTLESNNDDLSIKLSESNQKMESTSSVEDKSHEALQEIQTELDQTKLALSEARESVTQKEHEFQGMLFFSEFTRVLTN
jgi:chromosome segregation ATPase